MRCVERALEATVLYEGSQHSIVHFPLDHPDSNLCDELVQVAAVAVAMIELRGEKWGCTMARFNKVSELCH